jgi:mono/diheme cytochrome c family protein
MEIADSGPSGSAVLNRNYMQRSSAFLRMIVAGVSLTALLPAQPQSREAFTGRYCMACHNQRAKSGGFVLEGVSSAQPSARPEVWEKVVKKIQAGEMPPAGMPRPDEASAKAFVAGLAADLDQAAHRAPFAGAPVIRRLNRAEYANTIRDLLGLELPLAAELPQDQLAAGFDNIADALSMSPFLLERYLKVARRVSELATGTDEASAVVEIFPATGTQAAWQGEGMPFGTRGGIRVTHYFPQDGDYDLRAFLVKESLTPQEGVRFFRTRLTKLKAGAHTVIVAFPDEYAEREGPVLNVGGPGGRPIGGPLDVQGTAVRPTIEFRVDGRRAKLFEIGGMTAGEAAFDGQPGPPALGRIEIAGPYNATGSGETPSRARIFVCRPAGAHDEGDCAKRILSPLVRRAFRRDIVSADLEPFLKTFTATRRKRNFDAAIGAAIRDVLLTPDFLFRLEFDRPEIAAGSAQPLTDFELASRLSYFLWSSMPDDRLLAVAASGKLRDAKVLELEVRRMLADRRSAALMDNFASQWLGLRTLATVEPDKQMFPEFDAALASAFHTETRLFVNSLIRENRGVLDLLLANYTYLDERLASHYGIAGVTGPGFRRVPLQSNVERGGLLAHGSILLLTSHSTRTSPVLRGKWILDNLLNSPPAPPPANIPPLDESPANGRKLTAREQVERHRANPSCASCHDRIDPLGFALENYDAIGRWRTKDEGGAIDASGKLAGRTGFSGPQGLKNMLLGRSGEFVHATTERLMTYALGRELEARDQPTVRDIMRQTEAGGHRFHDLIIAIVKSVPFEMRQKQER